MSSSGRHIRPPFPHKDDVRVPIAAESAASPGDRETVEAARAGDEAAWREAFDDQFPRLYRFFLARVGHHQDAEDLTTEVFLEAWRSRRRLRWRNRPFAAWLFGIARKRLASYYRDRPAPTTPLGETASVEGPVVRDEFIAIEVHEILQRLSPEHREALALRYIVGLSGIEAAAATGRSHDAFRSLLRRATKAFQRGVRRSAATDFVQLVRDSLSTIRGAFQGGSHGAWVIHDSHASVDLAPNGVAVACPRLLLVWAHCPESRRDRDATLREKEEIRNCPSGADHVDQMPRAMRS